MTVQVPLLDKTDSKQPRVAARVEEIVGDGFTVRKFAENFEVLVNVAGSTKRLKELVLQLAVRGRLSNPSGGTADSLIVELQRARSSLAKAGVRVGEASIEVADEEAPYLLPPGWRWVRLRDLGGFLGGGTPAKSNTSFWKGPLPWVSPKDMKRPYIDDAEDHISMAAVEGSAVRLISPQSLLCVVRGMILAHSFPVATGTGFTEDGLYFITKEKADQLARYDVQAGDLLFARSGATLGKVCVAPPNVKGWRMTGHILRVRLDPRVIRADIASHWLWASAAVKEQITSTIRGGTRPGYNTTLLESIALPIPPLEEQNRIVAKVEQLMKVCDDLEAKLRRAEDRAAKLVEAVVQELVA